MELIPEERRKWVNPIVIDTEKDAEMFIQALERAAAAPKKHITIDYKEITDINEIKRIFHNLKED